jgi:hypothetical protein
MDHKDLKRETIDAVEIFDWDYLVEIGLHLEPYEIETVYHAAQFFAYSFTSTGNTQEQNRVLLKWIELATFNQSRDTAEDILLEVATATKANLPLLRLFAKQNGIRLKRG